MKKLFFIALLPLLMMTGCENENNSISTRYVPCSSDDMQQAAAKTGTVNATEFTEFIEYNYTDGILTMTHNLIVGCNIDGCNVECSVADGQITVSEYPTGGHIAATNCVCPSQAIMEMTVSKKKYDVEIHVFTLDSAGGSDYTPWGTSHYTIDLNNSTSGKVLLTNYDPILEESQTIDENLPGIWECVLMEIPGSPENPYLPGDEGFNEKTLTLDGEWNFTETTDNGTNGGRYAIGSYSYEDPRTNSMTDGGSYLQFNYQSGGNSISIYEVDADTLWTYPEPLTAGGATFKYIKQTNN